MSQESKEPKEEKMLASPGRPPRKEVELFPPVVERNNQYISTPTPTGNTRLGTQISMFQPASFDEALDIVEALRSRHATTISLEKLKKADASRLVDFVAGASAALDGDFHKMTDHVFLFCPATIKIVTSNKTSASRTTSGTTTTTSSALGLSLDALFPAEAQSDIKNNWGSLWSRPQ